MDHQQIPGRTSEISVQKRTVVGNAKKLLSRTFKLPGLWERKPEGDTEKNTHTHTATAAAAHRELLRSIQTG